MTLDEFSISGFGLAASGGDDLKAVMAGLEATRHARRDADHVPLQLETIVGSAGTSVAIPANVPHTLKNATDGPARLLFVHQPAALESFFEEFGVSVSCPGETPEGLEPPDFGEMAAALERNGVHVIPTAKAVR